MADEPPTDDDMAGMWRELQWARARDAEPRLTRTEYEMRTVREYEAWRPRRDRDKAAIAAARAEALVSRPTRVEWWRDPTVERREAVFLTVTDAGKERGFALQRD